MKKTIHSNKFGTIGVRLLSESWESCQDGVAVVEVIPRSNSSISAKSKPVHLVVGINTGSTEADNLQPGAYTVRVYLPDGQVMAESVRLEAEARKTVDFHLYGSPNDWLQQETILGSVQQLPTTITKEVLKCVMEDVRRSIKKPPIVLRRDAPPESSGKNRTVKEGTARTSFRPNKYINTNKTGLSPSFERRMPATNVMMTHAVSDVSRTISTIENISGLTQVPKIATWRKSSRIDRARNFPNDYLSVPDLVRWWTGNEYPDRKALELTIWDEFNAKFRTPTALRIAPGTIDGTQRAFAEVLDPTGVRYYAVWPEGWISLSPSSLGRQANPSLLMTVIVDKVMQSSNDTSKPARWRCNVALDDIESMAYLGFLYAGQARAAYVFLERGEAFLFKKTINPLMAAAGAFGLLGFRHNCGHINEGSWRDWIHNLYRSYPRLPDAAIAMAQMSLLYGESGPDEDIDVEQLRKYALDAITCGLPYLTYSIRILLEILLIIVRDDEYHHRSGPSITQTDCALRLTQQLDRFAVPGEFFTVLRLGDDFK